MDGNLIDKILEKYLIAEGLFSCLIIILIGIIIGNIVEKIIRNLVKEGEIDTMIENTANINPKLEYRLSKTIKYVIYAAGLTIAVIYFIKIIKQV